MTDPKIRLSRRYLLAAGAAVATTGCYGSFNLTGLVYDWNGSFSSKWVRWLLFLGLVIIPVYGVMLFVDAFILNAIEFFSGEHPVERARLEDGSTVTTEKTDDPKTARVVHERDGETLAVWYCERVSDDELALRDEAGRLVTRVHLAGGGVDLRDGDGRLLVHLDEARCDDALESARRSGSLARGLGTQIAEVGATARLDAFRSRAVL